MKECITPRSGPRGVRFAEHDENVLVAIAHVDDERQAALLRQPQVAVEVILLHVERREVPVAIEPRLADRHDARLVEHRDDAIPIARLGFGQVVGLHADGRVHAVVLGRQLDARLRSYRPRCRSRRCSSTPAAARARDDLGPVVVELRLIEMRVRVEELHIADRRQHRASSRQTRYLARLAD